MLSIRNSDFCILSCRYPIASFCKSLLVTFFLLLNVGTLSFASPDAVNITIPLTSPSIVYTPFVCNSTQVSLNPQLCEGAWQMSVDSAQNVDMSTMSPSTSKNILPQLFFQFRASAVFITTSYESNATVDISISCSGFVLSDKFDSSLGNTSFAGLPYDQTTLFTLTVNPSTTPVIFNLTSITIITPFDATSSYILPAPTIPPSASLPTVSLVPISTPTPERTPDSTSNAPSQRMIAQAVGLTVGLGIGLTLLVVVIYYSWKWRRRRKKMQGFE